MINFHLKFSHVDILYEKVPRHQIPATIVQIRLWRNYLFAQSLSVLPMLRWRDRGGTKGFIVWELSRSVWSRMTGRYSIHGWNSPPAGITLLTKTVHSLSLSLPVSLPVCLSPCLSLCRWVASPGCAVFGKSCLPNSCPSYCILIQWQITYHIQCGNFDPWNLSFTNVVVASPAHTTVLLLLSHADAWTLSLCRHAVSAAWHWLA